MLGTALLVIGAYLLGSVSTAIIVCRLAGLPDPRTQGSRNPGATNVLRLGGKKAAAVVLLGDMLKGLAPVALAQSLGANDPAPALVGAAAFLGHLYPLFFRFQGGKGVATFLGVVLGLSWQVGLLTVATWLVMAALFRISSLAALTAALLTPLYLWWRHPATAQILIVAMMTVLLYWRHRSNIEKLLHGKENRIGARQPRA